MIPTSEAALPVTEWGLTHWFVTTTSGGIVPVTRINQHTFSNDTAGETTLNPGTNYWEWHSDTAMSEAVDYS